MRQRLALPRLFSMYTTVQYVNYQEAFIIFVHGIPRSAMFQPSLSWKEVLKPAKLTVGLTLDEARLVTTYDDMTESSSRKEVHSGQWIGASSFTNIVLPEGTNNVYYRYERAMTEI